MKFSVVQIDSVQYSVVHYDSVQCSAVQSAEMDNLLESSKSLSLNLQALSSQRGIVKSEILV